MDFRAPERRNYLRYRQQDPLATASPKPAEQAKTRRRQLPKVVLKSWKQVALIVLSALLVFLIYGYIHTKNQLEQAKNQQSTAPTGSQQLLTKVGQLVQLPSGEAPTIATVNDVTKLKNQAFFSDSKNGDKVIIYSKAGKAILYRPSTNKVIEYSTVNLQGGTGQ